LFHHRISTAISTAIHSQFIPPPGGFLPLRFDRSPILGLK
jgi:hypothetical protein